MELSSLATRLNVNNRKVVDKAKEYQRLVQRRVSGVGATPMVSRSPHLPSLSYAAEC
jgi:hypothetical protein